MAEQNYYTLLGVATTATTEEITDAYKNMVRIWHPDKCKDKTEAEQKFKLITKAFSILSKEQSRKHYDAYNTDLSDSADVYYDPFNSFKNELNDNTVPNVIVYVEATIDELYTGVTKSVEFSRYSPCSACDGYGTKNKTTCSCRKCDGKGQLVEFIKGGVMGYMINQKTCDMCNNSGIDPSADICELCKGIKYVKEEAMTSVVIPAGAYSKYVITHETEGNFIPHEEQKDGKNRTNALFVVKELDSPFKRGIIMENTKSVDMANVLVTINITFEEALCGFEKCIEYINSQKINIIVNDIVQNNDIFVMKHMGLPKLNFSSCGSKQNSNGHLFIKFCVQRLSLSIKQKRKIWQLLTNTSCTTFDYSKKSNLSRFEDLDL